MEPISHVTRGIRLENYQVGVTGAGRTRNQEIIDHVKPVDQVTDQTIQYYDLYKVMDLINSQLTEQDLELSLEKHEGTGRLVARLIDSESGETIREVPPERLLDFAANMNELLGILIDERI